MAENKSKASNFVDFVVHVARVTKVTKGWKNIFILSIGSFRKQAGEVGIGSWKKP